MPFTSAFAFPYLANTDAPDIPQLGKGLAEAVEAEIQRVDADAAAVNAALTGLLNSAVVATAQATSSTSYVDLATVGPAVTKTIGTSGKALVIVTCFVFNGTAGALNFMGYAVSGATTLAASDDRALILHSQVVNGQGRHSAVHLQTGLTPGSNTFTAKYKVNAGTGTYSNRSLIVVAL